MIRSSIVDQSAVRSRPRLPLAGVLAAIAYAFCLLIGDGPRTVLDWAWLAGLGVPLLIIAGFAGLALWRWWRVGFTRAVPPADGIRWEYDPRRLY